MAGIENPWAKFEEVVESGAPYVLAQDRGVIEIFNKRQSDPLRQMFLRSIPEPFIGNPETARLVLLNLNPGHSDDDEQNHRDSEFRAALLGNLAHVSQDFPFYPLNPAFVKYTGAGRWWHQITSKLQEATSLDASQFAKRIMVIEWFPYHSPRSGLPLKQVCPSQTYSFELARRMARKPGAIVLGMRSRAHWLNVIPAFKDIPFLFNKQRPFITRGNMVGTLFDDIVALLKAP